MPRPPMHPSPASPPRGGPAGRPPPRRPCAPAHAAVATAPGDGKKRAPERRGAPLSSSWPSDSLKRPPARRSPGPSRTQPPTPARAPAPASPGRPAAPATCAAPPRACCSPGPATPGAEREDPESFSLSLTPEAILLLRRRHLEKQLMARLGRPPSSSPSPAPRARPAGPRRGATPSTPDSSPTPGPSHRPPPRAPLPPGGLQAAPGPRPVLKVSLLNERRRYDDLEYEEEADQTPPDEGLVRRCTEWLRGVEAAAGRGGAGSLDALPHLGTL